MIQHIKAEERHTSDFGWLQTAWLFSFSDYYDENNISHGSLRVLNDDVVQPRSGFGKHPHEEMEIISVVLEGEMVHQDTMGNTITVRKDDVQRMTAGTGIHHSEWNEGDDPVAFLQIWLIPDKKRLRPSYDQKHFDPEYWQDKLTLLASSNTSTEAVRLNTDGHLYRANLTNNKTLHYTAGEQRAVFLYIINGEIAVNGHLAARRDQFRISNEKLLNISSGSGADFLLVDTPNQ